MIRIDISGHKREEVELISEHIRGFLSSARYTVREYEKRCLEEIPKDCQILITWSVLDGEDHDRD